MHINNIIKKIQSESCKYKPIPFWSWNGKIENGKLVSQIDKMKSYNMGGYFMHARSGLQTEYLSDEWMEAIRTCADYGSKVGMTSWVYDENGYPSGFAGGKLLKNEEYHDQYLTYTTGFFDDSADFSYLITDNEIVLANNDLMDGRYINIYIHNSIGTADVLNKEVTDEFIEHTHQKYKEYFGKELSKKITGVFTDEPQYYRGSTAYTRVLSSYYFEKYNEDLFKDLGLLFIKKKGWRTFRYRYWKCMNELLVKNYAQNVYNWCEENNIKLTGHYVEETSLGFQMAFCGGVMPLYEYMHIPGIDWLSSNTNNELSPRQISSVAAQLGKKQILTESFACSGWQVKPKTLKRIAEFQFLHGVNLLCHHLVPYSEHGVRKNDHPAHYSSINPWIDYEFNNFNDYFAKLGYLMGESEELVNVAVLHPIRSAYFDFDACDYGVKGHFYGTKEIDQQFREDLRSISSKGINYHFIDETLLSKYGSVNDNKIVCGKKEYSFLILPHILTMDSNTENLIKQYVKNGGKVVVLGNKPEFLEGERYNYSYLETNSSFDEIINAQPFKILDYNTDLYVTYRVIDDESFIFIQNASVNKMYNQTFDLGDKYSSFKKLNLETLKTEIVGLDITLKPEESALLFLSKESVVPKDELNDYNLIFDNAQVEFNSNNLVVDLLSYSLDGLKYSEKYPCEGLIIKLGKDKYNGDIYFKYEFDIREIPKKIHLKTETKNIIRCILNGVDISLCETFENDVIYNCADISKLIKIGKNEFVIKMNWFQSKEVQYILEGDNINGSLGNMLTYDSEITPIYICGEFGVYSKEFIDDSNDYVYANDFYIGEIPQKITEPVFDGLPFFSGLLTLKQEIFFENKNISLSIPGTYLLAYVTVNGNYVGKLMFNDSIDISQFTKTGCNSIEAKLVISNRNLYGPFHFKGVSHFGVAPHCWDMRTRNWIDNSNEAFRANYELLKLKNS